jgi:tRNA(Ile)-lysidine synthetase-like protein
MRGRERDLLRPLLPFSRRTLLCYARRRGLRWWEDPANADPRHLRSWIRGDLLPTLAARLPDIDRKLAETRRHAARERRSWDVALRAWPGLDARLSRAESSVSWVVLQGLPAPLAATLAEALMRSAGGPTGPGRLRRALTALAASPSGAVADLGKGWRLELAFGRLRVLRPRRVAAQPPMRIEQESGESAWGDWRVRWSTEPAPVRQPRDGQTAWFIPGTLSVRRWRPGDRLAPLGGRGHRLAVRCFQDARIPRSERERWPVVEGEGDLAWIPGVCRSGRLLPPAGVPALRIDVEPRG